MISKDTVETFTKTTVDELARRGMRRDGWQHCPEASKDAYRQAVREAFKVIGVKVEGGGDEISF
jgi:hypothetical protein